MRLSRDLDSEFIISFHAASGRPRKTKSTISVFFLCCAVSRLGNLKMKIILVINKES